ncbi:MAG TPA: ferritin-like domain-containing protein [Chitinispirillaceae bacterium]|jgi:rubrerythrin|nr:ferritin-like domain-containing protein [Chitinispirillaceae bacterium]
MNNKEIAENLKDLVKLFSDSAWNYEKALDQIQDEDLKFELSELHNEHLEHAENLNKYLRQLGEKTPRFEISDETSELITITSEMSDDEVIRNLRRNERVVKERLSSVVEDVQIPELAQELEEDIEDESIYIDTLQNLM